MFTKTYGFGWTFVTALRAFTTAHASGVMRTKLKEAPK